MKKNSKFEPLVSIVIPVFNGENYVAEAIDSALAQTYKNIEIIVVNDGSTDKTEEICLSYGDKIRYFSKVNGGTSTALNMGIKNMKGTYFSWLSHDDKYYPDKIKRQIEELSKLKNKDTIMMTDLDGIDENYQKIYETHYINHIKEYPLREKNFLHPVIYNQTHGCTLLFSKKCFEEVGLFDETSLVAQDFEFFYRAFSKFPHKLIPEILVTARDSSNRQGKRSKVRGSVEYSDLFIKIIENLTEQDYKELAPSKLKFYEDMLEFYDAAGYDKAYNYINSKVMRNLQISSYDLIGNKFNGHDLHNYLREKEISSKQLVWYKQSNDINTIPYDFNAKNATRELLKNKLFYESDIIHFQLIHEFFDISYLPLFTKLKPCVITLHDPYFLGGHCVHHFDCEKWKKICYDCEYLNEFYPLNNDYSSLNYYIKKEAIQNSQLSVIVASEWLKKKVEQSSIFNGKKIYTIPFGIDLTKFKPTDNVKKIREELEIPADHLVIMFRSNNGSFKGLPIIKKALNSINPQNNITIITTDQIGNLHDLEEKGFLVKEYGWINDDDKLIKLYQACDIFLMPSKQETFGMMAIEAMACGKFVLSINSEGSALSEVISSPNAGMCVEENDFSDSLIRLISNKKDLIKKGEKCREFVEKNYSKEKYVDSIIRVYRETINNHIEDDDSKVVLDQLRKYNVSSQLEYSQSEQSQNVILNQKKTRLARKLYRHLPRKFRMKIKNNIKSGKNIVYKKLKKHIVFEE